MIYKCTVCDKTFKWKHSFKLHLMIHTGENPQKCTICSKTFRHQTSLKYHLLTHSGVKPHKCTVCDKAFKKKETMRIIYGATQKKRQCDKKNPSCIVPIPTGISDKWENIFQFGKSQRILSRLKVKILHIMQEKVNIFTQNTEKVFIFIIRGWW